MYIFFLHERKICESKCLQFEVAVFWCKFFWLCFQARKDMIYFSAGNSGGNCVGFESFILLYVWLRLSCFVSLMFTIALGMYSAVHMLHPINCSITKKISISLVLSAKEAPHLYLGRLLTWYDKMFLLSGQHSELALMVFHMTDNAEVSLGRTKNHDEEGAR